MRDTLYDSTKRLDYTTNPALERAVGVLVIDVPYHVGLGGRAVRVETSIPELTAASTAGSYLFAEAGQRIEAGNARAAKRCREIAAHLIAQAEALEAS